MAGSRKARPDAVARSVRDYYAPVADLLDRALRGRGDEPFWHAVAERGDGSVLEIGAGTGRITRILAPGRDLLVAIDLSPEMLRRARRALGTESAACLVAADIRDLSVDARFDLAVAANDPLAHLLEAADRDRALARIAAHLAPGGRFLHDALWLPPAAVRAAATAEGHRRRRRVEGRGEPLEVRERWLRASGSTRCRVRYRYLSGKRSLAEVETELRSWSPEEIRRRYRKAGLRVLAILGSYDGRPWSERTAEILLVEAGRENRPTAGVARRNSPAGGRI